MSNQIDRASESYARAVEKIVEVQPKIRQTDKFQFTVEGSGGNSYHVFLHNDSYGCECRMNRKAALCYHVVAADLRKREVGEWAYSFCTTRAHYIYTAGLKTLIEIRQREIAEHRAGCTSCSQSEECSRVHKLFEKLYPLVQTFQPAWKMKDEVSNDIN
ncbi:MAG: hypothetical protein MSG64_06550 [Pyrinomonadaceae bacterium MAG19_C2-C3]|nr:hypothetical protein [Pyrinomonadaceae bacterium MAG19_C2-C3]